MAALLKLKSAASFYTYYCGAPLGITLLSCYASTRIEGSLVAAITGKVTSEFVILYFVLALHSHRLYYYYNLHISRIYLLITFLTIDLLFFAAGLWITHLII